jgi:general secretion pathway protein G
LNRYIKSTRSSACASDLRTIEKAITAYVIDRNALPASLNDVGMAGRLDPWKRPYVYQVVVAGSELVDFAQNPLNTDYDLYSMGQDGASTPSPGNDPSNADDIARANDGSYVGVRP